MARGGDVAGKLRRGENAMLMLLGHLMAQVTLALWQLGSLAYSVVGWGLWLMFAVWLPVSFIGIAIGTILR